MEFHYCKLKPLNLWTSKQATICFQSHVLQIIHFAWDEEIRSLKNRWKRCKWSLFNNILSTLLAAVNVIWKYFINSGKNHPIVTFHFFLSGFLLMTLVFETQNFLHCSRIFFKNGGKTTQWSSLFTFTILTSLCGWTGH